MIKLIRYGYGKRVFHDTIIMQEGNGESVIVKNFNEEINGKFFRVTLEEIPEEEYYKSI